MADLRSQAPSTTTQRLADMELLNDERSATGTAFLERGPSSSSPNAVRISLETPEIIA
jgi:hypothetical protein